MPIKLLETSANRITLVDILKMASDIYYNEQERRTTKVPTDMIRARDRALLHYGLPATKGRLQPFMTDKEFDALLDKLRELKPTHPFLSQVGAPVRSKQKVRLPYNMPSLDKIKPESGNVDQWLARHPGPYLVSDKIDGVSLLLDYAKGKKIRAFKRGDGITGTDMTSFVPHLRVPKLNADVAVRGEIVMPISRFNAKWAAEFKNARNLTSGITNRNDVHEALADVKVVIYEVLNPRGIPSKQLAWAKSKGFTVVGSKRYTVLTSDKLLKILALRKKNSKYEVDGLVITQDKRNPLPSGLQNPDWSIAFKAESLMGTAITKIIRVEWNVTRTGFYFPRLVIKPVNVSGVTVRYISGKSGAFIKRNRLGPGAEVRVRRSGDVIPDIQDADVIKGTKAQFPTTEYEWEGEHIRIPGDSSEHYSVKTKAITYFFSTIGVENFKLATVEKFVNHGLDSVPAILKLTKPQFVSVPGGTKTLNSVYDQIQKAINGLDLALLMAASQVFGRSMGYRRSKAIIKKYPNILDYAQQPVRVVHDMIVAIPGFQSTTAGMFANNLKTFANWLRQVPSIKWTLPKKARVIGDKMAGQVVCVTGFRNEDLAKFVTEQGGQFTESFSRGVTLLLHIAGKHSSKIDRAKAMGIRLMTLDDFSRKYGFRT
jgi:NAD-dependent DNA ligase